MRYRIEFGTTGNKCSVYSDSRGAAIRTATALAYLPGTVTVYDNDVVIWEYKN